MNQDTTKSPNLHPEGCTCMPCLNWARNTKPKEEYEQLADLARERIDPKYHQALGL